MSKPRATLVPQRNDGKGWTMCSEHRATAWLVVSSSGKPIQRFESKATAKRLVDQHNKPRVARPQPGDRLQPLPSDAPVLVRGLSFAARKAAGMFK